METCQSGLTYLFAKEAGASKPLDGSNPSVSARSKMTPFRGSFLLSGDEHDICMSCVRDSKDFSLQNDCKEFCRKVPAYVIGEKCTHDPSVFTKKEPKVFLLR